MRDYPNGGFFFIDAAPIKAAGASGLKIDGIFEDAKRAVAGGKVFVLSNYSPVDGTIINGVMTAISGTATISARLSLGDGTVTLVITSEDVVTITAN